jgi:hypothetical protein
MMSCAAKWGLKTNTDNRRSKMLEGLNAPEDWGVADKNIWVTDQGFNGEAVMPVLEGYDVVGFSESVDFAVTLSPQTKQAVAINPKLTAGTDTGGNKIVKNPSTGAWRLDRGTQQRMSQAVDKGKIPREHLSDSSPKPKPKPKPKPESQPTPEKEKTPEAPRKQPQPPKEAEEETVSDIDRYSLDVVTNEDVKRVADIASKDANNSVFEQGQIATDQIDSHYSRSSRAQNLFNRLPQNVGMVSDALKAGDLDAKIKMKGGKEVLTVREIMLQAGVKENELSAISSFITVLDSQTESNGTWSTSATYSLAQGLDYFSSKMIEQRSDLADPNTSVENVRTKALSLGSFYEDSKEWTKLSPEAIDLIFETRPAKQREALKKSGTPGENSFYNPDSPGEIGSINSVRGRMALFLYARQGGRDCYSGAGKIKPVGDFQVEHVQDLSSGGRDHRNNFTMSVKYVNEARGSLPLPDMVRLAQRKAKEVDKNLADPSGDFLRVRLTALKERGVNDALSVTNSPLKGTISDLISPKFFKIIADKQKGLPEQLRTSQEDFDTFAQEINNNFDASVKITDLSKAKLDSLISSIEKLGTNSDKVREYLGRILFNNYHDGSRPGRGGTNESPAGLHSLENRALGKPDIISTDQYKQVTDMITESHGRIRDKRETLLKDKTASNAEFHEVLSESLHFLAGKANNSPQLLKDRPPNPRDILFVIDTYLKNFPPERKVGGNLDGLYLSAAISQYGFSAEEIANPNLIRQKAKRNQAEKLRSALKTIRGGNNE